MILHTNIDHHQKWQHKRKTLNQKMQHNNIDRQLTLNQKWQLNKIDSWLMIIYQKLHYYNIYCQLTLNRKRLHCDIATSFDFLALIFSVSSMAASSSSLFISALTTLVKTSKREVQAFVAAGVSLGPRTWLNVSKRTAFIAWSKK